MVRQCRNYNIIQYKDDNRYLVEIQKFIKDTCIKNNYIYGYLEEKYITEKLLEELLNLPKYSKFNIKVSAEKI